MAWTVELTETAARQLDDLDSEQARRILKLMERISSLKNPRSVGQALKGSELGDFWKYRAGDYRLICELRDKTLVVLVIRIGHRKDIYR